VATKSADGKTCYVKAVNPTNEVCSVTLTGVEAKSAVLKLVTAKGLNDRNTLENPNAIAPKLGEAKIEGKAVRLELPAYSAGVLTLGM
jgi:alpha-L-arabinofuranosidase